MYVPRLVFVLYFCYISLTGIGDSNICVFNAFKVTPLPLLKTLITYTLYKTQK